MDKFLTFNIDARLGIHLQSLVHPVHSALSSVTFTITIERSRLQTPFVVGLSTVAVIPLRGCNTLNEIAVLGEQAWPEADPFSSWRGERAEVYGRLEVLDVVTGVEELAVAHADAPTPTSTWLSSGHIRYEGECDGNESQQSVGALHG